MKKTLTLLAVLLLASFVLAGCGERSVVEQTASGGEAMQTGGDDTETADPASETISDDGPDISALKGDGLECLRPGVRVCLPVNYATADVGDTVGFAFGTINQFPDTKKFAIKLKFVRTQQSLGELAIETDKDYMGRWLNVNDLDTYYELDPKEKFSNPILVKVMDEVAEGKPTQPGAYVFEVQAQTFEDGFYDDYGGAQQITVRVQ